MLNNLDHIKRKNDGSYVIICEICGKEDDIIIQIISRENIHYLCPEHHIQFLRKEKLIEIGLYNFNNKK